MSESDRERVARSLALEQAYVHEVFDQCAESTVQSRPWPRIYQFLEDLEPGALVCDVGCGNGNYLNVKHSVFNVGVDRCIKLTNIAREKENEVLVCDNLSLPFRDESFDAVLSIAVVHYFSTTERRVRALKELARVLRIGGRLIISVWAMEQRHRKFESQDVLIPWPKAFCLDSTSNPTRFSDKCCNSCKQRDHAAHGHPPSSQRHSHKKCKSKSYWIDPMFSPSPSTSSLSSPNETCYSFFRRVLQKLAGGRRGSRPWFLENWPSNGKSRRYSDDEDDDDVADVNDIPIELRRLEDPNVVIDNKQSDNLSIKSKSLFDILEIQRQDLVRSRSSIPGLCSTVTSESHLDAQSTTSSSIGSSKPKLVKQKSHLMDDDDCLEIPESTAIQRLLADLPDFQDASSGYAKRGNVHKQSSMNEELMSIDRIQEKERVKQNIMKQASLNEEIICKRRTLEAFKESIYSGNATKRFQFLTSGLTNKIKQSTTSIEKVSGMSIRNGFVRILQSWKSTENETEHMTELSDPYVDAKTNPTEKLQSLAITKCEPDNIERRLSREDGSDSSKDSSLQSDTSVDSEDSFASVIYVPKQQSLAPLIDVAAAPPGYQLSTTSAPPSPRVKYPPELSGPRMKLISISPLLKQFPATSKSLPPPSPPGLSPRTINSAPLRPFFDYKSVKRVNIFDKTASVVNFSTRSAATNTNDVLSRNIVVQQKPKNTIEIKEREDVTEKTEDATPLINNNLDVIPKKNKSSTESINEDENRKTRLNQIKELLRQKPEFATRTRPSFPLVRRASSAVPGRLETVTKVLPRLLSLELFNPETDDLDSDSSGVSSPESVGSVISVISDERYASKKENAKKDEESETSKNSKQADTDKVDDSSSSSIQECETKNASPQASTWSDECRQHLLDFTEKLSENLIRDIDQYCRVSRLKYIQDLDDKAVLEHDELEETPTTHSAESCKYSRLVETMPHVKTTAGKASVEYDNKPRNIHRSDSLEKDADVVGQTFRGKFTNNEEKPYLRFGNSIESSDIGDSIENTISECSQESSIHTNRICSSTASLASSNMDFSSSSRCSIERHKGHGHAQPPIERIPSRITELKNLERSVSTGSSSCTLSNSSSQESLPSDQEGGGAITYHQYCHVFREGELDQLINKYVENLHIISSYYDHASWCIVAEKVQVWTI